MQYINSKIMEKIKLQAITINDNTLNIQVNKYINIYILLKI